MATLATPDLSAVRRTLTFARHFFEMCVPMCVGGFVLYYFVFTGIPGLAGWGDLRQRFPEASLVVIALLLSAPMTAWMVFRGMPWRPTLEMAAVPVALAPLVIGLEAGGVLADGSVGIRFGELCGLACIGMLGVMLFRLDLYAGRAAHGVAHSMTTAGS